MSLQAELWHSEQRRFRAGHAALAVCDEIVNSSDQPGTAAFFSGNEYALLYSVALQNRLTYACVIANRTVEDLLFWWVLQGNTE